MAKFTDKLRDAILEGSWDGVVEFYVEMTGDTIDAPNVDNVSVSDLMKKLADITDSYFGGANNNNTKKKNTETPNLKRNRSQLPKSKQKTSTSVTWGGNMQLITDDVDEETSKKEIESNMQKAERANIRKMQNKRPPSIEYDVVCSHCNKTFKSKIKPMENIGTSCSSCIRALRSSR